MSRPISPTEAYGRAAAQCAVREYCRSDWRDRFRRAGLSAGDVEALLDRLEDEGFIDEARYARSFVHDKTLYDRWGRIKTRQALRLKGIPGDLTEVALAGIDEADYEAGLADLLARKERSLPPGISVRERQARMVRYAAGRGFEPQLIFRLLRMEEEDI